MSATRLILLACRSVYLITKYLNFFLRDLAEIKESENRAHVQGANLRNALNDHNLELRVKAAHEAEAACQQRLFTAEAEIAVLRAELDASDRFSFQILFPPYASIM